jgi:PucR family transcriptional regulator, purine catabolism regulatory protein
MLTVRDIVELPDLGLSVAAGSDAIDRQVTWIHVSELSDPTPWLEGGELLVTTGIGIGESAAARRAYLQRLASHGVVGLAFGIGFGHDSVPRPLVTEAERLGFPILVVPYEVPFIAITKAAATSLTNERLGRLEHALVVHEQLSATVLEGRGVQALLAVVCEHVGCSARLVDERGRVLGERHGARRLDFEGALELPVVAGGEIAQLGVATSEALTEEDRLVLHHAQTALAFELSRRRAVSSAELRLAGDLIDDLLNDRLDEREITRRLVAFGLDPERAYAGLLIAGAGGEAAETVRIAAAREIASRGEPHLSAARRERAAFLVAADDEAGACAVAEAIVERIAGARAGVGRPATGRGLGRSLLEARAALDGAAGRVATYRDLGSLELLLGLPGAALEAFVDRVLGPAAAHERLVESLAALLDTGCRWSEAADSLGIHRHTLRYRMEQLRKQTGRHPDDPAQRMELWLAIRAREALEAHDAR